MSENCGRWLDYFFLNEFEIEMARRSLDHFRYFRINFLKQMQSKKIFQK
jgi:hypothetical protein